VHCSGVCTVPGNLLYRVGHKQSLFVCLGVYCSWTQTNNQTSLFVHCSCKMNTGDNLWGVGVNSSDLVDPNPNPKLPMSIFSQSEIVLSTPHRLRDLQDPRDLSLRSQLRCHKWRISTLQTPFTSPFCLTTNHWNMDHDLITVSSLTDEPSNLTEIFYNSMLPGSHDSRRTYTNFLVRANKLPNCVLTPITKKGLQS
jgi:hypothetical protein